MVETDAQRSQEYQVPEEKYETAPEKYENVSLDSIKDFTLSQFLFWLEDDFAADFRRMLALEQYRDAEMAQLYSSCITAGPVAYMEDIFREMIRNGVFKEADPKQLATEFYAPLFLLVSICEQSGDKETAVKLLNNHIARFIRSNAADGLEMT